MAQKKGGGSTRNGRDSESKRLGVKAYGGELIPSTNFVKNGFNYFAALTAAKKHIDIVGAMKWPLRGGVILSFFNAGALLFETHTLQPTIIKSEK